jgi:hypothetical protein
LTDGGGEEIFKFFSPYWVSFSMEKVKGKGEKGQFSSFFPINPGTLSLNLTSQGDTLKI